MPTNGEACKLDEMIGKKVPFDQSEWHKRFSATWNDYAALGRAASLRRFYDWCKEPWVKRS